MSKIDEKKFPMIAKASDLLPTKTYIVISDGYRAGDPSILSICQYRGEKTETTVFEFFEEHSAVRYIARFVGRLVEDAVERSESCQAFAEQAGHDVTRKRHSHSAILALLAEPFGGSASSTGCIQINVDQGDLPDDVADAIVDKGAKMIADEFTAAKAAINAKSSETGKVSIELKFDLGDVNGVVEKVRDELIRSINEAFAIGPVSQRNACAATEATLPWRLPGHSRPRAESRRALRRPLCLRSRNQRGTLLRLAGRNIGF